MAASQADDGVDNVTRVLRKILGWLDAHDDVLPRVQKKPAPSQKEETALANAYKWARKLSDAYTKQQRLLQQEIVQRATDPRDLKNIEDIKEWSSRNNGRMPMQRKDDKEQTLFAFKLDKIMRKDPKSQMLQTRLAQLLENAHQTPTKACQRGAKQRDRGRAAPAFLQRVTEEHEEWCGLRFSTHEGSKRPPELQEKNPYPGLVNLGNTCYVNAVCQILFHCDAARNCLRSGVEVPEGSPASVADEESADLVQELQSLAQNFADGFPTELPGQRCRVDCWSPHALIDAFLRCRPLQLGEQHDAREALEEILTRTRLGADLLDTGAQGFQRSDIVSLPAFTEDGWWYQKFTSAQQVVRMRELLADGFRHLDEKLPVAPPLLVMIIPPFAFDESDTSFWLNGSKREALLRSDWGNYTVDLAEHFAAHCAGRQQAVYKLAGYVAYEGDKDVTPCWTFITGHFIAYFREGDDWYKADDSTVTPTGTPPTAFPYICIFERVDLDIALHWPPSIFIPDEAEEDDKEREDADEDEEAEEEEEEDEPGHQEDEEEGVEGEGEPPSQAGQGQPPPKRRRNVDVSYKAYLSLCAKRSGFSDRRMLSPKKILAHDDLETVIKLTRADDRDTDDPTTRPRPSSTDKDYFMGLGLLCLTDALPEAFFHDERHDLKYLFKGLCEGAHPGSFVDAMRRIIRFLPRGEGLGRATRAYFGLLWKQRTPWAKLINHKRAMPERFVLDRRDTDRSSRASLDNIYCFETLFFRMCEAANQFGRGKEIKEALPRPRLLLEAVLLSGGCVEGLKEVGVELDDHDYKTTHAELKARMQAIEAKYERGVRTGCHIIRAVVKGQLRPLALAVERLDEWREWSVLDDPDEADQMRRLVMF